MVLWLKTDRNLIYNCFGIWGTPNRSPEGKILIIINELFQNIENIILNVMKFEKKKNGFRVLGFSLQGKTKF